MELQQSPNEGCFEVHEDFARTEHEGDKSSFTISLPSLNNSNLVIELYYPSFPINWRSRFTISKSVQNNLNSITWLQRSLNESYFEVHRFARIRYGTDRSSFSQRVGQPLDSEFVVGAVLPRGNECSSGRFARLHPRPRYRGINRAFLLAWIQFNSRGVTGAPGPNNLLAVTCGDLDAYSDHWRRVVAFIGCASTAPISSFFRPLISNAVNRITIAFGTERNVHDS